MTMAVNMECVPKPESGTKVVTMTPPINGSADVALTLPSRLSLSAVSCKYQPAIILSHYYGWLEKIFSTKFSQLLKHCSVYFLRICVFR